MSHQDKPFSNELLRKALISILKDYQLKYLLEGFFLINQRFCKATRRVAGNKIKGRGGIKSKATQLYTPLKGSQG